MALSRGLIFLVSCVRFRFALLDDFGSCRMRAMLASSDILQQLKQLREKNIEMKYVSKKSDAEIVVEPCFSFELTIQLCCECVSGILA